tara:strand:+ start:1124 stop:1819 length:696 start_codon:yes stop_codon:yes gene_type:complete
MAKDRNIRRLINTKEDSINIQNSSSLNNMADGQISMSKNPNKPLAIYRKKFGRLWKSYMSADGNDIVDKNLTVGGNLDVKGHIVGNQYVMFCHNFVDDIATTEHTLPWADSGENTGHTSGVITGFLAPYNMTLKKIIFRIDIVSQQADITFKVKRVDSGDNTTDTIATAEYDATIDDDTKFELNRADFDNNPIVVKDSLAMITIQADADMDLGNLSDGFFITSVWEIEIKI